MCCLEHTYFPANLTEAENPIGTMLLFLNNNIIDSIHLSCI